MSDSQSSNMGQILEVVDLTDSVTYCPPITLSPFVIELDDSIGPDASTARSGLRAEPIVIEDDTDVSIESQSKKSTATKKRKQSSITSFKAKSPEREKSLCLGVCPICQEPLGSRPMASTKCGHVYCIVCVKEAVRNDKRCPMCRKPLNNFTSFHPLFL